jgi:hypothetical protein
MQSGVYFYFAKFTASGVYSSPLAYFDANASFIMNSGHGWQAGGGPWLDTSDARIKIVAGNYEHGLAEIEGLRPVIYAFRGNHTREPPPDDQSAPYVGSDHYEAARSGKAYVGLVAQECETVMPEMVSLHSGYIDGKPVDDLRGLDTGPLVYALVNAVKELSARLKVLEAK